MKVTISAVSILLICIYKCQHAVAENETEAQMVIPPLFHYDDYTNCGNEYGNKATYCLALIELSPENKQNISESWKIIQERNAQRNTYSYNILMYGLCKSDEMFVENNELQHDKNSSDDGLSFEQYGLIPTIKQTYCQLINSSYQIDIYELVFWSLMFTYIICVLLATLLHEILLWKNKYTESLSLIKSWESLSGDQEGFLKCIQGVRVYFSVFVIYLHTITARAILPVSEPSFIEKSMSGINTKFMQTGSYVMQICFLISSWMLTNSFLKIREIEIKDFLKFIYNRYIRIVPCLMIVVGVTCTAFYTHFLQGIYTQVMVENERQNCRSTWWMHLIFISESNYTETCLPEMWYLKDDMIFYLFTLVVLIFRKKTRILFATLALLLVVNAGLIFDRHYRNSWLHISMLGAKDVFLMTKLRDNQHYIFRMHVSLFTYIPAWVAGILYGYLLTNHNDNKILNNKMVYLLGILSALGVIIVPPFIIGATDYFWHALYASVGPIVFIFGIGLFVYGMTQKFGGPVRLVCESRIIQILGKLSFCAYILNYMMIRVRNGSSKSLFHANYITLAVDTVINVVVTYILSLFLSLIFEIPIGKLFKWSSNKNATKEKISTLQGP